MLSQNIQNKVDEALKELQSLNKNEISDAEFFKVWNKYLYGYVNMLKFEDILKEKGIIVAK